MLFSLHSSSQPSGPSKTTIVPQQRILLYYPYPTTHTEKKETRQTHTKKSQPCRCATQLTILFEQDNNREL
jgi:hypothetical protein